MSLLTQATPLWVAFAMVLAAVGLLLLWFFIWRKRNRIEQQSLERALQDRTEEILLQKEALEKQNKQLNLSYRNLSLLSEIGQQIASSLDIELLFENLYERVNQLVDASTFGFLIYHPDEREIEFNFILQRSKRLSYMTINIDDHKNRPAVWCITQGKPILINNPTDAAQYGLSLRGNIGEKEQVESLIYYPLVVNNQVIGAITIQSFKQNSYTDQHFEIIKLLASYTAVAYNNATSFSKLHKANQELRDSQSELSALTSLSKEVNNTLNSEEILNTLHLFVKEIVAYTGGFVTLINTDTKHVRMFGSFGEVRQEFLEKYEHIPFDMFIESLAGKVYALNQSIQIDYQNQPQNLSALDQQVIQNFAFRSALICPLQLGNKTLGTITFVSRTAPFWVSATKQQKLNRYIGQAASAISNAIAYQKTIETERKIRRQNKILQKAYLEIEVKNNDLTASINYAKHLQESIMPDNDIIAKGLNDLAILYQPKDIVSGDFYWYIQKYHYQYLVVADCTGHGVPGAFMTVMGSILLNSIVNEGLLVDPRHILSELDKRVREIFGRSTTEIQDNFVMNGMDMAICLIDRTRKSIQFAGANRPLYITENGNLNVISGDRMSVGMGLADVDQKQFTQHFINYHPNQTFYLFSDGFRDQFGGADGRKYSSRRFRSFITGISQQPLQEQTKLLAEELSLWRGSQKQVDDILIMGFKP